jgi:hypothetical protein
LTADEVSSPNKTRVEVVQLEGVTIGRFKFEPGWRWCLDQDHDVALAVREPGAQPMKIRRTTLAEFDAGL